MPRGGKREGAGRPPKVQDPAAEPAPEPAPDPLPTGLRLEWRDPAELAENPANWRRHPESQVTALTDVMTEVGWAGACLYNERTGRLLDGHARKKVALEQGAGKVPVLIGNWTEEQERKILATLDPLAAMAEADTAALDALLHDIETDSPAINGLLADLARLNNLAPPVNGPAFEPRLEPTISTKEVTPEDLERAGGQMQDRLNQPQVLIEVLCPHCAQSFHLDPKIMEA